MHTRNRQLHWYAAGAAILGWSALVVQLYIICALRLSTGASLVGGLFNFISFFTILTNLLVALALTLSLPRTGSGPAPFFSRPAVSTGIAASIALVGITYSLLLRQLWQPQGLQLLADMLLHDVMPVVYLFYWWRFVPRSALRWRLIAAWALYPALYLLYALVRGKLFGLYPYPFIDAAQLGYAQVMLNSAGMLTGFIAIAALLIGLDRLKRPS